MPPARPGSGRSRGRWLAVLVVLVLLGASAVLLWLVLTARPRHESGEDPQASLLERWATQRLESFLDDLLVPDVRIGQGRYEPPRSFVFDRVALVHQQVEFLAVERLRLDLVEIPTGTGPMRVSGLSLVRPRVVLAPAPEGGLVGFSHMVEPDAGAPESRARLSDALRFERIEVVDGRLVRRTEDGRESMIDGIGLALDATRDPRAPGAFSFGGSFGRPELVEASLRGRLDLDELSLLLEELDLRIDVGDEPPESVPPAVRDVLDRYKLHGRINLRLAGRMPVVDAWGGVFSCRLAVDDAYAELPDRRIDIDDLELDAHVAERRVVVEQLEILAAQGRAQLDAEIVPEDRWRTHLNVRVDGMRFEEFYNAVFGDRSDIRGRATFDGALDLELLDVEGTARGAGRIAVDPGRLSLVPWLEALGRTVGAAVRMRAGDDEVDRGESDLEVVPGEVRFRNLKIVVPGMATRGEGELRYDGTLDFRVNAGPIERLQEATGPIGSFFGAITDRLGIYHVTGPSEAPSIRYRPFGL